jgi:hypothetical protein
MKNIIAAQGSGRRPVLTEASVAQPEYIARFRLLLIIIAIISFPTSCSNAQQGTKYQTGRSGIYSSEQLAEIMKKPPSMGEYLPTEAGPLRKPDGKGG